MPVKTEIRRNAAERIRAGERLFPEVLGYEDTVFPNSRTRSWPATT
ncbi:MAG: hypothetical protein M5U19_08635 [Microthrixaceae bacterium]|nr:hypothetical protein [Microthrixaceae bacterium]